MKKRVTQRSLRQGQTIYAVNALGESSYVSKLQVLSRPYRTTVGVVVRCRHTDRYMAAYETTHYLQDMGIIANGYNHHRAFYSRKKANSYLARCIRDDIGGARFRERFRSCRWGRSW